MDEWSRTQVDLEMFVLLTGDIRGKFSLRSMMLWLVAILLRDIQTNNFTMIPAFSGFRLIVLGNFKLKVYFLLAIQYCSCFTDILFCHTGDLLYAHSYATVAHNTTHTALFIKVLLRTLGLHASSYPCMELCLCRLHLRTGYVHWGSGPSRIRQPLQLGRRLI